MENRIIGVLGTGTMGAGIVQLAAGSGYSVVACDGSVEALEKAQVYVRKGLDRFAKRGIIPDPEAAYARIRWTTNLEEFADAEAVIEAIVEQVEPKKEALELAPIGWQRFALDLTADDQTAVSFSVDTFATRLLAQPLSCPRRAAPG